MNARRCGLACILAVASLLFIDAGRHARAQSPLAVAAQHVLLPRFLSRTADLKRIIAHRLAPLDTTWASSLRRIDEIFAAALDLTEGDMRDALLICAMSTIPYRDFDARIPLIGLVVDVPISFETDSVFRARRINLPTRLFRDSPAYGDRDKIPHFFGSAWLQCSLRMPALVRWMGLSVETFEKLFFLEGAFDPRDVDANMRGIRFGNALMREEGVLPSWYFR